MFINKTVFEDNYKPENIIGREDEQKQIQQFFNNYPEMGGNLDIVGTTGCGKTLCVYTIQDTFERTNKNHLHRTVFINCRNNKTTSKVMVQIARELTGDLSIGYHKAPQKFFNEIRRGIKLLVILDEVNLLIDNHQLDVLYTLSNESNVAIINVSNDPRWREKINDNLILSRMPPHPLVFPEYTLNELYLILKNRAETGLEKNSYSNELLSKMAERTYRRTADARQVIDVLKTSADIALSSNKTRIELEDVIEAEQKSDSSSHFEYYLDTLFPVKRGILLLIYEMNRKNIYPTSSKITEAWERVAKESSFFKPLKSSTVRVYLTELQTYDLIEACGDRKRGKNHGRGTGEQEYRLNINLDWFEENIYKKYRR